MQRAVVSLPDGLDSQARWLLGELCGAAGVGVAPGAAALPVDPGWDLAAAAATLARTEELHGPVDEHGRFPASASALAAGAAPLDDLVLALREAAAAVGAVPAPDYPGGARFAVALTHDIDTPWRWSGRGLLGAAARLKGALGRGDSEAARLEADRARAGAASIACAAAIPTGRTRASPRSSASTATARPASSSRPIAIRTTAPRPRPTTIAGRASCTSSTSSGSRSGCTRATAASASERLLSSERAELARLLGGPIAGNRHHYLRLPWHEGIRALDRLGFAYDSTLGWAERTGPARGTLVPVPALGRGRRARPMRILELPLVLMDATLAEERYLGLSPETAWDEIERVLDHLHDVRGCASILWHNDRFDGVYGRGWDRLYERLLDGIAARGGRADSAGALADALAGRAMRVLIVSFYFPPAGGGGVQRVLKLCRHLPELGVEVDVLAPDDPKWGAVDPGLAADIPPSTTVHRARYRGPSHAQTPAARLAAARRRCARIGVRAALLGRRVLLPDPEIAWFPDARARRPARRARARDRRRALDLAAQLGPRHRRSDRAPGGRAVRGRLPRLLARQSAPAATRSAACAPSGPSRRASPAPRCAASPP